MPRLLPEGIEKVCSTTPMVFNLALRTSAIILNLIRIHYEWDEKKPLTIGRNVFLSRDSVNFVKVTEKSGMNAQGNQRKAWGKRTIHQVLPPGYASPGDVF